MVWYRMLEVISPTTPFHLDSHCSYVCSFRHHFPHQHFQPTVAEGPTLTPTSIAELGLSIEDVDLDSLLIKIILMQSNKMLLLI